ncbi:MAG: glycosyltransferase [Flavobacteriaceae bacterium]
MPSHNLTINTPVEHFRTEVPSQVLVTVIVNTYNQENYISTCLDGILNQKTNFDFEILLGEDDSDDKTKEICIDYAKRFPKKIRLILHKNENKIVIRNKRTGRFNFLYNLYDAKGKYIALCEGDDYWTDENKLQKQVNFLEANKDFSLCFHSVDVLNEIKGVNYNYPVPPKDILDFKDLAHKHYIPTCSVLFPICYLPIPCPDFYFKTGMLDIPIELMLADKGKVKYFSKSMAVYRKNADGVTQNKIHLKNGRNHYIFLYKSLKTVVSKKHHRDLNLLLLKVRLGKIKDLLGINPLLKK